MQPLHVATEAEISAMHARLARRVNGSSGERIVAVALPDGASGEPAESKPSPLAATPTLQWERPPKGATAVYTTDKRYCCSKVTVQGQTQYELWKAVKGGLWARPLASQLKSFDEAKRFAEEDAGKADRKEEAV
jgi:hypothetical protein